MRVQALTFNSTWLGVGVNNISLVSFRSMWEHMAPFIGDPHCTLSDFLDCAQCAVGWSNRQTRMLGAGTSIFEAPTREMLEHAIAALDSMPFVGLVHRFDDSIRLFRKIFHEHLHLGPSAWHTDEVLNRAHFSVDEPIATTAELERLRAANQLDIELLNHGEQIFEALLRKQGISQ